MDELKKPYKITLWEDKPRYIYNQQNEVTNQWLEEVCIATIGSNTMDTPIRAFNPILTEDLNGSKTFTFITYYRYWDDEAEEFKINPFTNLLVNERKVKLKYGDDWYDFVIKQVQENSENNTFTYTCKDLFVNELGKTGYDVELNIELSNNMGTVTELGERILDGSTWTVDKGGSDLLRQYYKESLYAISFDHSINAVEMISNTVETIPANTTLYTFYSCKANNEDPCQVIWVKDNEVKIDEQGFITNGENYKFTATSSTYSAAVPVNYFGKKLIQRQQSKYFPEIEETCYLWEKDGEEYYAFTDTEYASAAEIQQLLSNNSDFMTTNGWSRDEQTNTTVVLGTWENNSNFYRTIQFQAGTPGSTNYVYNSGFYDNRAMFSPKGTIAGEPFIFAIKTSNNSLISGATVKALHKDTSDNDKTLFDFDTQLDDWAELPGYNIFRATCENSISYQTLVNEYKNIEFKLAFTNTVDLVDIKVFRQQFDSAGNTIIPDIDNISYSPVDPYGNPQAQGWYEDGANGIKVPTTDTEVVSGKIYYSGATNAIIRVYYNFFPKFSYIKINNPSGNPQAQGWYEDDGNDGKVLTTDTEVINGKNYYSITDSPQFYSKDDLVITERVESTEDYTPIMAANFEKVTSITGAKSNRFNLIQNCCEAFECWAKFSIEHDNKGRTVYTYEPVAAEKDVVSGRRYYTCIDLTKPNTDDSAYVIITDPIAADYANYYTKQYHKYVTFKEFIGQENFAGFRYGINLKSISRQIVSDQIATKVIVQAATNDLAPNGVCTIQQAALNPTGENALYNFQYFINHGLLDQDSLYDDLYGTNGGLGFFTQMYQLNKEAEPKIEELAKLGADLNTLESRNTVYTTLLTEAENKRQEIINELNATGYGNDSTQGGGEYIDNLRRQRNSYTSTISHYTQLKQDIANLLYSTRTTYQAKLTELEDTLNEKTALNNEFHNKYSQFIQEGTWTSNEYYDPNLYYEAATMVSFTSAFPQISYTINVIEISQVEGFAPYTFKIGDKTYVEDVEFFGYDDKHRPYKEEIVVSQVKINLDDPSQNTLTVRNYKTQFQDLFQRIAATSQSLQYHEGEYNRAAAAVTPEGEIDSTLLQNSLMNNALIIQNAKNQNVIWDDSGITISNSKNPNEIVKLTSGGIVLTADGGQSWTTGITGSGINANVITAGRIDTSRIRIFNEGQQTFEWNGKGIHAFAVEDNKVNYGKFVRFDQYGLYGYAGGNPNWDPDVQEQSETIGISKVIRDSIFSLTWEGLSINVPADSQTMDIINVTNGNSSVFKIDKDGKVTCSNITINGGSINWDSVSDNGAMAEASAAASDVYDLARGEYTSAGTTFINGKRIYSPTIIADEFNLSRVENRVNVVKGIFKLNDADSANVALEIYSCGAARIVSEEGDIWIGANEGPIENGYRTWTSRLHLSGTSNYASFGSDCSVIGGTFNGHDLDDFDRRITQLESKVYALEIAVDNIEASM